jgi:hypothetical protein
MARLPQARNQPFIELIVLTCRNGRPIGKRHRTAVVVQSTPSSTAEAATAISVLASSKSL